jgi:hypothetical protein
MLSSSSSSSSSSPRTDNDNDSDSDENEEDESDDSSDMNDFTVKASLDTVTTFRDDVRSEWIRAMLGPSFVARSLCMACPQNGRLSTHPKGKGLARLGEYTAYAVTIPTIPTIPTISSTTSTTGDTQILPQLQPHHPPTTIGTGTGTGSRITMGGCTTITAHTMDIPPDDSLGLSLSRLALGLYVRQVRPGSEASCAGILPQSVLISINGMALLAEPSKQALERLWQYEGYLLGEMPPNTNETATPTMGGSNAHVMERGTMYATTMTPTTTTSTTTTTTTTTPNRIQHPLRMTFIYQGNMYSVVLLSNPPYGIDWAPCGNFCLVKKCKGRALEAGIIPGSIITSIHGVDPNNNDDDNNNNNNNNNNNKLPNIRHFINNHNSNSAPVHLQDLDHTLAASTLRKLLTNGRDIHISLCVLPRKARSGFYEDGHALDMPLDTLPATTTTEAKVQRASGILAHRTKTKIQRRKITATLDGVEVRVHPLLQSAAAASPRSSSLPLSASSPATTTTTTTTTTTITITNQTVSSSSASHHAATIRSLSQLAFRVAAGEFFSFAVPQYERRRFYSQRNFRSCPPLDQPLPELLSMDNALSYLLYYHYAKYDDVKLAGVELVIPGDSSSQVLGFFQRHYVSSVRKRQSVETFLLPIMALIRMQGWEDSDLARMIVELAVVGRTNNNNTCGAGGGRRGYDMVDIHLAHAMEFMARAMDLTTIKGQLATMREKREIQPRQPRQIPIRIERAPESPTEADASVVTGTTVLSTAIFSDVSQHEGDQKPLAKSRKGILGMFRKKKKLSKSRSGSPQASAPVDNFNLSSSPVKTFQLHQTENDSDQLLSSYAAGATAAPRFNRDKLFANTILFLEELEAVCADIEKSLLRSFSQKIAAWALQPWSANKETELAQVTQVMRERLRKFPTLPLLNPIDSSTLVSVDPEGSYILPSAHFPLLLTFDCQNDSRNANDLSRFGADEAIYRTKVELLELVRTAPQPEEATSTVFVVHCAVGGTVAHSGPT